MARIRSIKPEVATDQTIGQLSDAEFRLLMVMMANADDYGNIGAEPKQLHGLAFWGRERPADVPSMLRRLERVRLVTLYSARGHIYAHLEGWNSQSALGQKVDHPGKPIYPGPELADKQAELFDNVKLVSSVPREPSRALARVSRLTGTGTGTGTRTGTRALPPVEREETDPGMDIQPTEPDSPHNLLHVMGVVARRAHPEVGLWAPGRFADKDAVDFFRSIPDEERASAAAIIRKRIEAYFAGPSRDGWTLKGFLDQFNQLGAAAAAPVLKRFDPTAQTR